MFFMMHPDRNHLIPDRVENSTGPDILLNSHSCNGWCNCKPAVFCEDYLIKVY